MKYWLNGALWGGTVTTTTNNPGGTKYWLNGAPYLEYENGGSSAGPVSGGSFFFWFPM